MNSVSLKRERSDLAAETHTAEMISKDTMQSNAVQRRQSEEEQAQSQVAAQKFALEWQLTFDAIESPVVILDLSGHVMRLNQAAKQLLGNTCRESTEQTVGDLGPGQLWQKAAEMVCAVGETGSAMSYQTTDEASGKTWDVATKLVIGPKVDDERIILVARDETQKVELEASLRRNEIMSMMGLLVADVAHEARNPLFAISSVLDAFEMRFHDRDEYKRYTHLLREQVGRLNELMEELLDYGKPPQQQFYQGSIGEVVARAIRLCIPLAKQSGVHVVNKAGDHFPPVMMCRRRLPKVFTNLIKNAIQHSPAQSTVTVEAQEVSAEGRNWIDWMIKDSGPGFREEDLPKIFEPFYTKRRAGTGLGLSIVRRIVEEHGGRIHAGNRSEGGAFMVARFPVATVSNHE